MCSANAKPAALRRLWHMLTRTGKSAGQPPPALFISRRSSATGSHGARTTADPSCQRNTVTPKTRALISARADKATNKSLRGLYLRQHMNLAKGEADIMSKIYIRGGVWHGTADEMIEHISDLEAQFAQRDAALNAADKLSKALGAYNRAGAGPLTGWQDVQDALAAYRKARGQDA